MKTKLMATIAVLLVVLISAFSVTPAEAVIAKFEDVKRAVAVESLLSVGMARIPIALANQPDNLKPLNKPMSFTTDFVLEGTVPVQPIIEDIQACIFFPPRQPTLVNMDNIRLRSRESYKVVKSLRFNAVFTTARVSLYEWDEFAIFVADNVATFKGNEFGIRVSLKDSKVHGYCQYPVNTSVEVIDHLLFINDNKTHNYEIQISKIETKFLVDGVLITTILKGMTTNDFYVLFLAHRYKAGGAYDGTPYHGMCKRLWVRGET